MVTNDMDEVTRRWKAREDDRVRAAAERSRQVQDQSDPRESVDTFAPAFRDELREARGKVGDGAQVESTADAKAALQTLQQRLAAAAYWLPQYELRQLQAELAEAQAEAAKVTGPRKRFAFSARRAVAAEAPPGALEIAATSGGAERQSTPSESSAQSAASSQTHSNALSVSQVPAGTAVCIDADGRDVTMNGVRGMRIDLTGCPTALYVTEATDCHVCAGPVAGACLIQGGCHGGGSEEPRSKDQAPASTPTTVVTHQLTILGGPCRRNKVHV